MLVVAVVTTSAVLASNIRLFSSYVDGIFQTELDRALLEILNEVDLLENKAAHIASLYFATDSEIVRALESGDRDALLRRATILSDESGVDLCFITDTSGRLLAKPHAPELYGDDLSTMQTVRAALSWERLNATEGGATVDMAACSGGPIFDAKGRLLGTAIVGFRLDTEEFVDKHKRLTGCEVTIVRGNGRVATTLRQEDGMRAVGTSVEQEIIQVLLDGEVFSGRIQVFNKDILAKYRPILDVDDNKIGALVVGIFLTEKIDTIWSVIKAGLFSAAVILGIGSLIIVSATEKISAPIKKIVDATYYDALTGIYNRRFFDKNVKRIIKSMSRTGGVLSLMMIDVDFFKNYNDTYGHDKGDNCLKIIAQALAQGLSRADDFVARYGGEEFVIVLPNTDENGARSIAAKLLENIRQCNLPHEKSDAGNSVTISIGITTGNVKYMQCGSDYVKQADKMLYISKQSGRNRYTFEHLCSASV